MRKMTNSRGVTISRAILNKDALGKVKTHDGKIGWWHGYDGSHAYLGHTISRAGKQTKVLASSSEIMRWETTQEDVNI